MEQIKAEIDLEKSTFITASELIEYLFCPRFIYFMNCLSIPQHEDKRYKVLKGRELHEKRQKINPGYLRKKLGCVKKDSLAYLASPKYHIKGVVDEVLFLEDGTIAPLDYKFAEYHEKLFSTHKYQSVFYGLLLKENYQGAVNRGYVCYIRSKNLLKEIKFQERDFEICIQFVKEILEIIQKGLYPKGTKYKLKCIDCCYKNICV